MTAKDGGSRDDDELIQTCVEELETALADFADEHHVGDDVLDYALFTCAVQRAVDAGIDPEAFLLMLRRMLEESAEMGALEERMSLTRGEA